MSNIAIILISGTPKWSNAEYFLFFTAPSCSLDPSTTPTFILHLQDTDFISLLELAALHWHNCPNLTPYLAILRTKKISYFPVDLGMKQRLWGIFPQSGTGSMKNLLTSSSCAFWEELLHFYKSKQVSGQFWGTDEKAACLLQIIKEQKTRDERKRSETNGRYISVKAAKSARKACL